MRPSTPANSAPPPLPPGWERWKGARPEPRGYPHDTILALPGLGRLSTGTADLILDLCAELGMPVDSLAITMYRESGFKVDALNPLPAAGLIQLTRGASLPGFSSDASIRAVATWSGERQVREVVRPYYRRFGSAVKGADPGLLFMLNFLPDDAYKPDDFRLGDHAGDSKFRRSVYDVNKGLDGAGKGYFTIRDVKAAVAYSASLAKGRRMTLQGGIV